MNAPVTTFVLHWNRPEECAKTVRSLLDQGVPLRVTVLDNHSKPQHLAALRAMLPEGVAVRALDQNLGWGGAFNTVLTPWASGEGGEPGGDEEFCFVSAHDALPEPGCLAELLAATRADGRIGIACPRYVFMEWVLRFSALRGVHIWGAEPNPPPVQPMPAPHGTLMLFRRACLREIGVFDPRYFAYGDEHDLGLRASRAGWTVALVWAAIVINPGRSTPGPTVRYLCDRNNLLLIRQHAGRLAAAGRLGVLVARTVVGLVRRSEGLSSLRLLRARWCAMRDFLRGRFGPPPPEVLGARE